METISREFRVALPWELLYADVFTVIAEIVDHLIKRLTQWKDNVENRSMKVATTLQLFNGSLDFVRDYPDELVPER